MAGLTVPAADALKGALVILLVRAGDLSDYAMFIGALAVVIGNNWPIFLRFRGGKGVDTIFGLSIAVPPIWTLIGLCLTLSAIIVATHFGLAYRQVIESMRKRGIWGLFEVD